MPFTNEYTYVRKLKSDGSWDVNNHDRSTKMGMDVQTSLSGKHFTMHCKDGECKFLFKEALTTPEKLILDGVVASHQNNT